MKTLFSTYWKLEFDVVLFCGIILVAFLAPPVHLLEPSEAVTLPILDVAARQYLNLRGVIPVPSSAHQIQNCPCRNLFFHVGEKMKVACRLTTDSLIAALVIASLWLVVCREARTL
jgi:hypothetical protein